MASQRRQIVVYPDRLKLLRYALLYVVGIAGLGLLYLWIVTGDSPECRNPRFCWPFTLMVSLGTFGRIVGGVVTLSLAGLLAVILVCTIFRIVVRKPAVIVNSDGITDGCSLIAGGLGLVRWDEIEIIEVYSYNKRAKYLSIMFRDALARLRLRQNSSPLIRLFQRSITLSLPKGINLPEWLLSMPVDALVAEMQRRYQQALHAHKVSIFGLPHISET